MFRKNINITFLLMISLITSCFNFSLVQNDVDSHLSQFNSINLTHQDNIDDGAHSHSHKHSEDGDEHEHNHEHSKIVQGDFKILCHDHKVLSKVKLIETSIVFFEKNLISNPHHFDIFRPPIV